ncbi:hypothetical protein S40288_07958 [Stachybotrys chartarum IBT 40288]|nr:hypothetical protein S40288_07958 [Stachybotrys chartarum IBT 40288]
MKLTALLLSAILGLADGLASTDTITWGGDNSRAGYFTNHNMDPAVVGSSSFGQVWQTALPGNYMDVKEQAFAQPLVYTPSGGDTQYVYYATTQNNLYKIDAKTGAIVSQRNLAVPFLTADLDGCLDINPTVGVIGTGVIDPETDTLYLTTKTYVDQAKTKTAQGRAAGRYLIQAIDTKTLESRPGFPVDLEGITARNAPERVFHGGVINQRPGLLQQGQFIYIAFGSHCVQFDFTGWVIGIDKATGQLVERFSTMGPDVPLRIKGASIWMSGGGITADDAGSIFYSTGNGYASQLATVPVNGFQPPSALEEAVVHMTMDEDGSLNLVDFFMPHEKQQLDGGDQDLGTTPIELLPSDFSCGNVRRMGVITGKSGRTYWLNMDNLGGYRNGKGEFGMDDIIDIYQHQNSVYSGAGVYPLEGGYIYIHVIQFPTVVFKFSCNNGVARFTKVAESPDVNAYVLGVGHGTVTSLGGQPGTGLVWVTDVQQRHLKIYDAIPVGDKLNLLHSFVVPGVVKFSRPVFGDGMVYFGTNQGYLYAYGSTLKTPVNCTAPVEFEATNIRAESAELALTCTAIVATTVTAADLETGHDFSITSKPELPLVLTAGTKFTVEAKFKPQRVGLLRDNIVLSYTGTVEGYSKNAKAAVSGTGASSDALLSVSPSQLSFVNIVASSEPNGLTKTVMITNQGSSSLSIDSLQYSQSADGPWTTWTGSGDLSVSNFTVVNIPHSIAAHDSVALRVTFDSTVPGNSTAFLKLSSNGGDSTVVISGSAGSAPQALIEFEKPDKSGWVTYDPDVPFNFGEVMQNTARSLLFRVSNNGPADSVRLSITVSKPPIGSNSIIRAANSVDLGEGTVILPGESQTAVLTCAVPKSQWNVDSYNGSVTWTMNTNDLVMSKQVFEFFCEAIAEQAPPLLGDGQGKYRYIGCFKENNPGRQLANMHYSHADSVNADCIAACDDKGSAFCGTQYHRECWGGNVIPRERVDDGNCNFHCSGALDQTCGGNGVNELHGGSFISLFADSEKWNGDYSQPADGAGDAGGVGGDVPAAEAPKANPGTEGYVHLGCYTEVDGRALPIVGQAASMDVAGCVSACKKQSLGHAGVQYGGECWCGDQLAAASRAAPLDECNIACGDNAAESCGGTARLNVYKLGDGTPNAPAATTPPSTAVPSPKDKRAMVGTWPLPTPTPRPRQVVDQSTFQGCYDQSDEVRSMPLVLSDNTMTPEKCGTSCPDRVYWAVRDGTECYCDNDLEMGTVKVNIKRCNISCPGDPFTFCGGKTVMQLFRRIDPASGNSDTTRLESVSGIATAPPTPANASSTASPGTVQASVAELAPTTRISPVRVGPTVRPIVNERWGYQGCYAEPPNSRALPLALYDPDMTLELCAATCPGRNYFGVEYGSECYCGNTVNEGTTKLLNATECNFLCPGDPATYCGAVLKLQLYQYGVDSIPPGIDWPPSLPVPSRATPASSWGAGEEASTLLKKVSTDTATDTRLGWVWPTPTPAVWRGNSNFTYYNCVAEPASGRLLNRQVWNDGQLMTAQRCVARCTDYDWAGLEYGRECWCSNLLFIQTPLTVYGSHNRTEAECDILCTGDPLEFCGGRARMTLYINSRLLRMAAESDYR